MVGILGLRVPDGVVDQILRELVAAPTLVYLLCPPLTHPEWL